MKTKKMYVEELSKDFWVECEYDKNEGCAEFWLCRESYGIKINLFGIPCDDSDVKETFKEFIPDFRDRDYMDSYLEDLLEGEEVDEKFNIEE